MKIKNNLKQMLPFVIGLALGAGLTRNKTVYIIFIAFIILMVLKNMIGMSATKIIKSKNKKKVGEKVVQGVLDKYVDLTEAGFTLADKVWNAFYGTYTFLFNVFLVIVCIILLLKNEPLWAFICFIALNIFMVQNQVWRTMKGVKK